MIELNENEVRVLASLYEKDKTTHDQYPLTLNSLTTACNQKSNRHPIVNFSKETVVKALEKLKDKKLVWEAFTPGKRVAKYTHQFSNIGALSDEEETILVTLMLRGTQTGGEIKTRSHRIFDFSSTTEVVNLLDEMVEKDTPLIKKLPRQPGHKECRYVHLLAGEPQVEFDVACPQPDAVTLSVQDEQKQIAALEERVSFLTDELADLKHQFVEFRQQFE